MGVGERMIDAEVLWTAGRREGALLSVLVAVDAAACAEQPGSSHGAAFRSFLAARHTWNISVEHRGQLVTVDQLMWKWLRCELAHEASLPFDVQFYAPADDPGGLVVRAGGAPSYCILLSAGWYWWLRRLIEDWLQNRPPIPR
ncbi:MULTISPECIES: hypothetical protein [Micromonospora]|uniref:Uncharacterized protein n=1 Tax=Micromonospora solifontis TaxID=2487138 RepID=A0ABX9WCG2_9ACTN|nr:MULTISPECIES: hypothetical protein [Micromonospora]NES17063.1 hypothetical protein [Micromonospora sp. PPF5-17B]NES38587.1 hypothetical protein [Micromonospora solifontis]NES58781.1 hypothetical protein [Micromonospora sp. PPF5-6]RNL94562.1 hypothetical protein EFE23_20925 [Micromonospora solifontis]